ncbi:MAG: hypothetical protein A2Y65_01295 [Deltaproteobacteria bacterium RBG_13_52_11]|nr:MAG: hypothetical protein A2Y65_01295 [Deltaproteobacteria bacterium RBG_13_52_11]
MPTNRSRIRRAPQNQIVEPWMYDLLLDGRESKNFKEFCFDEPRPGCPGTGKGPYWWEIWDLVKNNDIVKQWRRDHPGQIPAAERC